MQVEINFRTHLAKIAKCIRLLFRNFEKIYVFSFSYRNNKISFIFNNISHFNQKYHSPNEYSNFLLTLTDWIYSKFKGITQ